MIVTAHTSDGRSCGRSLQNHRSAVVEIALAAPTATIVLLPLLRIVPVR